jgi:molecular chaperone HtpG
VFITDEVKDIVPEFLMLLHGVIDSPDIPLNVSRSFLQSDANVKKINAHITKKVADKLAELFKKDRKAFEEKWESLDLFVKYGMISDEKFYDKAKDFLLLQSLDDKKYTISEYKEHIVANQTDKDGNLVHLYAQDPEKQDGFVQAARSRSFDVLKLNGMLDSHFINQLEMKLEKTRWKRVDSETADKLVEKAEAAECVLSTDDQEKVKKIFEETIANPAAIVQVEALSPDDLPVVITRSEFMRRMKDMSKLGGNAMFMGNMPDSFNAVVNGNHRLVARILQTEEEDKRVELARQVYELGLLAQNMLSGTQLTSFLKRSVDLISQG